MLAPSHLNFDRVCLVGHSFGGDIALRAAGICRTKIDMAVSLATPHTYLTMQDQDKHRLFVPVFCTWESRQNIKTIVNLFPENDTAVVRFANQHKTYELSENDAIPLSQGWQEHLGFPRLASDTLEAHAQHMEQNILVAEQLDVANASISVQSFVDPGRGSTPAEHSAIHSRRMGFLVGELIHDGVTDEQIKYLSTLVQPKDADDGELVADGKLNWSAIHY